jgi:hypothetical protein
VSLTREQEAAWMVELVKMGKERVRASLDHGTISPAYVSLSWDWLSLEEAEGKRRRESSNSEQLARRASEAADRAATATERQAIAAERANTKAAIALAIAIISIIVSAIGIWMPYWDAHK